jgi:GH18 family chitinase
MCRAYLSCVVAIWAVLVGAPRLVVGAEPKIVAYVPNWIHLKKFAEQIDYDRVTHLNVAFENPTNDRGELSFHQGNAELIAKAHERGVKVLVSIGGGAAATDKTLQARYFDLISETKRAAFAKSLADYVTRHKFDGLDVDIEGPSINKDYGPFIAELAKVLKPEGKLLTAALSQGYGGKNVPDATFEHFDWINIMAYDGAGPWNPQAPGQHSSLEFAKRSVDYWLKRGLPKSKAVLGVPFYGYGFGEHFRRGGYTYAEIVAKYPGAENADQAAATIWYNGIPTIQAKTAYAIEQELAGIMIWSLNQDAASEKSLLKAIAQTYAASAKQSLKKSDRTQ